MASHILEEPEEEIIINRYGGEILKFKWPSAKRKQISRNNKKG